VTRLDTGLLLPPAMQRALADENRGLKAHCEKLSRLP
jgi:hypothetical protein